MNPDGKDLDQVLQDDLAESIFKLATLRSKEAAAKEQLNLLRAKLQESPSWMNWAEILESSQNEIQEVEPHIRELAETNFAATENKSPHPAVKIREKTVIEYDPPLALAWCRRHLPEAIVLDAKLFEKHARAVEQTAHIQFVKIRKEPQATIATDLSRHLSTWYDQEIYSAGNG